jgi:lysyl-tRNA synthetase class 2
VLNIIPGGATARPFKTFHKELKQDMYLRIAPELFLKTCVVGGMHRVFEIGKNFRNEGIDQTHNPEYTACEVYQAFADYKDMMKFTEDILSSIVMKVKGSYQFDFVDDKKQIVHLDFTPPFKRISMMEELERILGEKLPQSYESDEATEFFDRHCVRLKVPCSHPRTTSRLIDKLVGELLEPNCIQPTFIMEQP